MTLREHLTQVQEATLELNNEIRKRSFEFAVRALRAISLAIARSLPATKAISRQLKLIGINGIEPGQGNTTPTFLLLVAGNEVEYKTARAIIERHGIHTLLAGEAEAAKQLLAEFTKIDGILIWPNMSWSNLSAFIQFLRWQHPEVPVVMIATEEQLNDIPPAFATILTVPYSFRDVAGAFERARRHKPVLSIVERASSRRS